jgi:hypothetical protein
VPIGSGYVVASGAPFEVKRFVVQTNLPAGRRVRAMALKQGDRRVVRHAAFYDDSTGRWIGGWTPWQTLSTFAGEVAVKLPANARIAVEIGYIGTDQDVTDKSELGLYFADDNGTSIETMTMAATEEALTPGATRHRVRAEAKIADDTKLLAFWPQLGDGAQSLEITAVDRDGMTTPLLWLNQIRPEWPSPYMFESPHDLPRGSRLVMTAYYENADSEKLTVRPRMSVVTAGSSRPASVRQK